ncbi:MAG: LLM class flavin-dependent oxidoreductase [Pseudomonadota bacterium]
MKLGIWTPLPHVIRDGPGFEPPPADDATGRDALGRDRAFQYALDTVQAAERHGFDITLIAERLLGPDLEAWILAAALAAATQRIELMVAVHPGIVTPQMVAKMGATLDRISAGRAAVNVVAGWWQEEMDLFGNGTWLGAAEQRAARLEEFVRVLKTLWTQGEASFDGTYFNVARTSLQPRPWRAAGPPIFAASRSPEGKDVVARYCDWWFAEYKPGYRLFEANLDAVARDVREMGERADRAGRGLDYGLSAHVICTETMAEAVARADELEAYGKQDRKALRIASSLGAGLVGTPEVIAARIRQYQEIGIGCLMLRFHPMFEDMELFAARVMPLLGRAPQSA